MSHTNMAMSQNSTRKLHTRRSMSDEYDRFIDKLDSSLGNLARIWNKIGLEEDEQGSRMHQFYNHLEGLLQEMIESEQTHLEDLSARVSENYRQIQSLENELGVLHKFKSSEKCLLRLAQALEDKRNELVEAKDRYIRDVQDLDDMQNCLCQMLGQTPMAVPSGVPTTTFLNSLRTFVEELVELKENRTQKYNQIMNAITDFARKMDNPAPVDDTSESDLTPGKLLAMELKLRELQAEYNQFVREITERVQVLEAKLTHLQDKCCIPQELRLKREELSVEIHQEYSLEVGRLEREYESKKELYDIFSHWLALWNEKVQMELHPRHSYGDRGGALQAKLKRERHLSTSLPRMANSIGSMCSTWNAQHPTNPCKVYAMNPSDYIHMLENKLVEDKQNLKKVKPAIGRTMTPPQKSGSNVLKNVAPSPTSAHKQIRPVVLSPRKKIPNTGLQPRESPLRSPKKGVQLWVQKKTTANGETHVHNWPANNGACASGNYDTPRYVPGPSRGVHIPPPLHIQHQLPESDLPSYHNFSTPLHINHHMRSSEIGHEFSPHNPDSPTKRLRFC